MTVQEKLYTIEEFWAIAQKPENENKRLELVKRVIYELAPSSKKNTITAIRFASFLLQFADEHDLGYVSGADGGFELNDDEVRLPDVAFISKDRAAGLEGTVFAAAPDLAIEVISPSESPRKVLDKVRAYLRAGTKLVWTAYPDDEVVDAHHMSESGSLVIDTFGMDDTLDGGSVLPGFKLPIRKIFPK
jgi:Uma2 family endonuclease